MRKLTILMAIALTVFGFSSITSAQIVGTYEMIATGSCLHSTDGFTSGSNIHGTYYTPIEYEDTITWGATTRIEATWVFYGNRTGSFSGTNYIIDFPPGSPGPPGGPAWGPRARQCPVGATITYEVDGSDITIRLPNGTLLQGSISLDKKNITLLSPNELFNYTVAPLPELKALYHAVCNTSRILIKVGNVP